MKLCYENTIDDVIAFTEVYIRTIGKRDQRRTRVVLTLIVFGLMYLLLWREGLIAATFMACVVSGLLALTWPSIVRNQIKSNAKKRYLSKHATFALRAHELQMEEMGLRERDEGSETFYQWDRIQALFKQDDRVFVYLGETQAHIIPLNRAVGEVDASEFVRELANRSNREIADVR
jgi:hypothetical protein